MKPYDPNKRYLGPQGSQLNKYIPETPPNAPSKLKELWNEAAYYHDCDFEGDDYAGFWGWLKKWTNKEQVKKEILDANNRFSQKLILAVERTKDQMSMNERMIAYSYAKIVHEAVDRFGWAFYKTGGSDA